MGKEIDPADIGKHPDLIRKAQTEMTQSDVLVCGRCHNVFHFVELFKEHKESATECRKESTLKDCRETKAKVWAFLLWKAAQLNADSADTGTGNVNSWKLYQTWVKLEESVRETWIVAGRTIQSFARMGQGSLQEMPVKITKTIIESGPEEKKPIVPSSPVVSPTAQNRFLAGRKPDYKPPAAIATPTAAKVEPDVKKPTIIPAVKKPEPVTPLKPPAGKRSVAKRTTPGSGEVVEEEVEKILAKRFNPRRKEHEYLVKWSKYAHDQNTWEPLIHLQTCQSVLEYFEVQLAKQKEQRAAAAARTLQQQQADKAKTAPASSAVTSGSATVTSSSPAAAAVATTAIKPITTASSSVATVVPAPTIITVPIAQSSPLNRRPMRDSKINAMDKVKQWVNTGTSGGSSSYEETSNKRKIDADSDFDAEAEEEQEVGGIKKVRTDSGAAAMVTRAQPASGVKIVPIAAKSPVKVVNGIGTVAVKKDDGNVAEVIVKTVKDGTASGVVKKPGFTGAKNVAGEAKVQIVNRGEVTKQGVFKVNASTPSPQPSPVPAVRTTPPGTTTTTTTRIVRKNIGGTQQLVKQVVRTTIPIQPTPSPVGANRQPLQKVVNNATGGAPIPKVTTNIVQRSSLSPKIPPTKQVVNRNVKGTPASAAAARNTTPEQKINALRKQGLNVVKRVISPASSVEQKATAVQPEHEDDEPVQESFAVNIPVQPAPASPPRPLTLCPVTGKVLGQAEGEPTPVPSPEIQEQKKAEEEAAAQQQEQPQDTQVHQYLTNEDGSPIIVAGEDGTLYQVAGKNAEGQTILIAQGADGEQQCVLVASQEGEEAGGGVLTLDAAVSEAVAQIGVPQEGQQLTEEQYKVQEGVDPGQPLTIQTEESQDGQITAEVVQADQPSPGGTRRVVLLLPDGSFMMTEVNDEQYQSLNLVN